MIRETGQLDDTLVIITADHGEMLGDHFLWGKDSFHEAANHVPLIIRDPDNPAAFGKRVDAFTESVDVTPTILDWIGGRIPAGMDGRSLTSFLAEPDRLPSRWRDHVYAEFDFGDPGEPTVWQRRLGLPLRNANLVLIREDRYKLVHFNGGLEPLLFDMHSKAGETRNLAGDPDHSGTVLRLTRKLLNHRIRHQDHRLSDTKLTATGTVNFEG
ncbi:MAG: sulfatase-like hydrolase/transferase [Paracoccaceae bacterium]|nr:sulfatase-like hydrolase/transferase [Paracoccaceae bacterium]